MNKSEKQPYLPIGYWIKRADEVLNASIDKAQQENGLGRTDWQILNSLHELGSATTDDLANLMAPFADLLSLKARLANLSQRGLVTGEGSAADKYVLSGSGQQVYGAALALQKQFRQQAIKGVSEEEYEITVRVLQRIVENLTSMAT
ncbi:MAG TPA: hypothetical protein VF172_13640 [Nitrososphaera sp.]